MSVEAADYSGPSRWQDCQGSVINGIYPLRRVLHATAQSAVFLTDGRLHNLADAAIKIVRAENVTAELQLRRWRLVAGLSHPHLIRLLDSGQCQLDGHQCLFVVMEYAEQTLAQVLPHRALTPDEVREMLPPTLDALAFLHRKNLIHGRLKPASLLVVNDQLKLSSDAVRPAGEPDAGSVHSSLYDPPESRDGRLLPAGDLWGLGVTLVEALGRCLPWPDQNSESLCLPAGFPADYVGTIERCLNRNPALRPTASSLETEFKRAPPASPPAPKTAAREVPRAPMPPEQPRRRSSLPLAAALGSLLIVVVSWGAWRAFHGSPGVQPANSPVAVSPEPSSPAITSAPDASSPRARAPTTARVTTQPAHTTVKAQASATPRAPSRPAHPAPQAPDSSPSVAHAQMPTVPASAQRTIHGHVKVAVLVIVDRSGAVVDALVQDPGPSSYFAHLARDAARKWQFAPADEPDSRQWLVRFDFARDGTSGHASPH
jgi:TonB family protein